MNIKFEARPFVVHQLPLPSNITLFPEQAVLVFLPGKSHDFGARCYLRRSNMQRATRQGRLVDKSSFDSARAEHIRKLIGCANTLWKESGLRPVTLSSDYGHLMRFIDWCDSNGHSRVLEASEFGRAALKKYVSAKKQLVDQHQIHNNTAASNVARVIRLIEDFFACDDLARGLNLPREDANLRVSTNVPDDLAQKMVAEWATCIMTEFCRITIESADEGIPVSFPFLMHLPRVPNQIEEPSIWVFPVPPEIYGSDDYAAYDFSTGRILNAVDLLKKRPDRDRNSARISVERAQSLIEAANADPRHKSRVQRGFQAQAAFFVLFLAATGANESQIVTLPWSEELEQNVMNPEIERQGFRCIKYRAAGKEVSFEIGVRYMPVLRQFLKLRNYLLFGNKSELLFFCYRDYKYGDPSKLGPARGLQNRFYAVLSRFWPESPRIKSRQWRAAKQDFAIRNTDPAVSADLLQHSLSTALRSYSNGSEVVHQKEMGKFLLQMERRVVLSNEAQDSHGEVRSLGHCLTPQEPTPIVQDVPVPVDCNVTEGCLFCDKFRVHADEQDVRKLFSARHCIRVAAQYSENMEEHERVFGRVIKRIDNILSEIKQRDANLVASIERDVDEDGNLDSFWSAKLDTLVALGMELT